MSYDKILEDDKLLIKVFGVFLIMAFSIAPGGTLLLLERTHLFIDLEFSKLVFLCFVLSIPFSLVGFLLYLSHPNTLRDIANLETFTIKDKIWLILLSSYLWGFLSVGVMYISVRLPSWVNPMNEYFGGSTKTLYFANYTFMLIFLGFFMAVGMKRAVANRERINSSMQLTADASAD
ncbi:MAG: hypothetical protein ACYC6S_02575 [Desulfobulbia bacterium]